MAGPIISVLAGQCWEARVRTRLYGQVCLTRFWLQINAVPVDIINRNLVALQDSFETLNRIGIAPMMTQFMGDDAIIDAVIWHLVSPTVGAFFTIPMSLNIQGSFAGGSMPAQSATTVAYRGLLPLASRRGHINVPAIPREGINTGTGLLTDAVKLAAKDLTDAYLGIPPLTWGPLGDGTCELRGPQNPAPSLGYAIVQSTFNNVPGTQRQRKIGRGI